MWVAQISDLGVLTGFYIEGGEALVSGEGGVVQVRASGCWGGSVSSPGFWWVQLRTS